MSDYNDGKWTLDRVYYYARGYYDGRNWFNQKSTCLKSNAVTFTVYTGA